MNIPEPTWLDFLWISIPAFLCMIRLYFLIIKNVPFDFSDDDSHNDDDLQEARNE